MVKAINKNFKMRNEGIDLLRALTMFVMIFVNDFWKIHDVPHWLEHAKFGEDFMGLADVVFPLFLFVVGMSIPYAIENRFNRNATVESTLGHIFSRTLALLVMGAFITNSEARLSPDVSYTIGIYWILMVAAFILIWNQYPRSEDKKRQALYRILKFIGILILLFLAITFRNPNGEIFMAHWGILGAIGWAYLLVSMIYLFTRNNLKPLAIVWLVLVAICILGTPMKELWGSQPILALPKPNFYNEMLNIFHIGNGALPAFTMGGVIFSLLTVKYRDLEKSKKILYGTLLTIVLLIAGVISREFWILSKLSATPPWIFYVTAIGIATYMLLTWLVHIGKSGWFNIIKPAGTATLTCYLIPYIAYAMADLTGITLPDWLTHDFVGILNCLAFALFIIGITWLLGRFKVKLKI